MSKISGTGAYGWIYWGNSNALLIIAGIFSPQEGAVKVQWSSAVASRWATSLQYLGDLPPQLRQSVRH